jgi:uncharacterized protein
MTRALQTTFTLALAAIGGAVLSRFNVPIAWLLGALGVIVVAAQLTRHVHVPRFFFDFLQPVLGVALGSYFTPSLWSDLGRWPEVLGIFAVYILAMSLLGDLYFRKVARFDRMTAFFAGLPGGLSDLTLVGASMGANMAQLGIVHSLRILLIAVLMPIVLAAVAGSVIGSSMASAHAVPLLDFADIGILVACGVIGYFGGRITNIPAWQLLGPLIVSAGAHISGLTAGSPPAVLIAGVQVVLGAYIGSRLAGLKWHEFRHAVTHGLIWSAILLIVAGIFAVLCEYFTGFGMPQLLLAFAPGGITEMGILALSLGVDVALVATCHVARVCLIYLVVPIASRSAAKQAKAAASGEEG